MKIKIHKPISIILIFTFLWQQITWAHPDCLRPRAREERGTGLSSEVGTRPDTETKTAPQTPSIISKIIHGILAERNWLTLGFGLFYTFAFAYFLARLPFGIACIIAATVVILQIFLLACERSLPEENITKGSLLRFWFYFLPIVVALATLLNLPLQLHKDKGTAEGAREIHGVAAEGIRRKAIPDEQFWFIDPDDAKKMGTEELVAIMRSDRHQISAKYRALRELGRRNEPKVIDFYIAFLTDKREHLIRPDKIALSVEIFATLQEMELDSASAQRLATALLAIATEGKWLSLFDFYRSLSFETLKRLVRLEACRGLILPVLQEKFNQQKDDDFHCVMTKNKSAQVLAIAGYRPALEYCYADAKKDEKYLSEFYRDLAAFADVRALPFIREKLAVEQDKQLRAMLVSLQDTLVRENPLLALLEVFKIADPKLKAEIIKDLRRCRTDKGALQVIIDSLKENDRAIKENALYALEGLDDERAIGALSDFLKENEDGQLLMRAFETILVLDNPRTLTALKELFWRFYQNELRAGWKTDRAQANAFMIFREAIIRKIGKIGTQADVSFLEGIVNDKTQPESLILEAQKAIQRIRSRGSKNGSYNWKNNTLVAEASKAFQTNQGPVSRSSRTLEGKEGKGDGSIFAAREKLANPTPQEALTSI